MPTNMEYKKITYFLVGELQLAIRKVKSELSFCSSVQQYYYQVKQEYKPIERNVR